MLRRFIDDEESSHFTVPDMEEICIHKFKITVEYMRSHDIIDILNNDARLRRPILYDMETFRKERELPGAITTEIWYDMTVCFVDEGSLIIFKMLVGT